jgi:superoxide dismutase, Fe-Mn family
MAFELPPLPYPSDSLEPHIDKATMEIHHGGHHKAYVDNLNKALESAPDLQNKSIEDLLRGIKSVPANIQTAVRNNGGGHANHTMFWEIMGPNAGGAPGGDLAQAITAVFGGFDALKAKIKENALGQFGSGWSWLVIGGDGKLQAVKTANQDSPFMDGQTPILGIDVWEHAYYLKYQNKRADYVDAWWSVVNWSAVAQRFGKAKK